MFKKPLDTPVPDWDDPGVKFWDFEDMPIATFNCTVFKVLPDKKLAPSRLAFSDLAYSTSSIDKYEAEDWSRNPSLRIAV